MMSNLPSDRAYFDAPSSESTISTPQKRPNDIAGEPDEPNKRQVFRKDQTTLPMKARPLACPFFKQDPHRHWDCASYKAKNSKISHVKQHIYRSHTIPHYCAHCCMQFNDLQLCNAHIRAGCPNPRCFEEPDGITMEQRGKLSRRPLSKLSIQEQWYAVFDIVFPGHPRPPSPYNGPTSKNSDGTMSGFQAFIVGEEGADTVLACLLEAQGPDRTAKADDRLRAAVPQALQCLVDRWQISRVTACSIPVNPGNSSSSLPAITASSSRTTSLTNRSRILGSDSGISGGFVETQHRNDRQRLPIQFKTPDPMSSQSQRPNPEPFGVVIDPLHQSIGHRDWITSQQPESDSKAWLYNLGFDWDQSQPLHGNY